MSVTDEKIIERLRVLLGESDLQTTTEKMLRKKLEEEFKMDMTEKKAIIRKEIEKYLEEQAANGQDEGEDEEDEKGGKSAASKGRACILSEALQKFLGEERLPRTQVVKRIWEHIRANNLQDPKDRRKIIVDAKLRTLFTSPLTMFSMNSQLSKHLYTPEADEPRARPAKASGEKRGEKPKAEKPKPAKKAKAGDDGDGGGGGEEKKANNFQKPLRLSEDLASWCGTDSMARSDLTKFFWSYVKEHNLQDPSNKQFVLCDAHLKKLTGESRIQAFAIQKYLSAHIIKD